jgi:hypothetical protein
MTCPNLEEYQVILPSKTEEDYGFPPFLDWLGSVKYEQYIEMTMAFEEPEKFVGKKIGGFLVSAFGYGVLRNVRWTVSSDNEEEKQMHPVATLRDGRQFVLKEEDMFYFLFGISAVCDLLDHKLDGAFKESDLAIIRKKIRAFLSKEAPPEALFKKREVKTFVPEHKEKRKVAKRAEPSDADKAVVEAALKKMELPEDNSWMDDLFN